MTIDSALMLHESMSMYTMLLLMHATGHRPMEHSCWLPSALDLEFGFGVICDKPAHDAGRTRVVILPKLAIMQLRAYFHHIEELVKVLSGSHRRLAEQVATLIVNADRAVVPLFFSMDLQSGKITPLGNNLFGSCLAWPLRWNAARHGHAQRLPIYKIAREYISAELGHVELGQQAFGRYSTLDPEAFRRQLATAHECLLSDAGWSVQEGMPATRKRLDRGVLHVANWLSVENLPYFAELLQ